MIPMYLDIHGCMVSRLLCMNVHNATEFYFSPQHHLNDTYIYYVYFLAEGICMVTMYEFYPGYDPYDEH